MNVKKKQNSIPAQAVSANKYSVNSLMIMCTKACQLKCSYCNVIQGQESMSFEVFSQAVDLLLTTKESSCQLRFWGGEPLLRWGFLKKGIYLAEAKAKEKGKNIKFMITTNGLLLDQGKINFLEKHSVKIMFSVDGDQATNQRHRVLAGGRNCYNKLLEKLSLLMNSKLSYFVNMVVTPETVKGLLNNILFLVRLGVEKIQLCYCNGILWPEAAKEALLKELTEFASKSLDCTLLMNFNNNCEPTMLSQEIIADIDGRVYFDAAIFMEKVFPDLRKAQYIGRLGELGFIDSLYLRRRKLYEKFISICDKKQKDILENNINLGLALDDFFSSFYLDSRMRNEHPLVAPVIKRDIIKQKEVLSKLGIESTFLYLDGPCLNDCIFCLRKENQGFGDTFKLEKKLKKNLYTKIEKLCFIGNEPLLHPEIVELIELASQYGFKEIEIMTSGNLLSNKEFCRKLIKAGAGSFSFPLFAPREDIHDSIVGRQGAFSELIKAIKNILFFKGKVFIHTNLLRQNIDYLVELENFVKNELSLPFVILPIRAKSAPVEFRKIMPVYEEIIKKLKGINSLLGFPFCVVKRTQKDIFLSGKDISDAMKLYFLDQKFHKLKKCVNCRYYNRCPGFAREYAEAFFTDFVKPIR